MCFHKFVDGFGGMGDALVCVKCNHSKYPESLVELRAYKLAGLVIKNDGRYMHFNASPYVRKFSEVIEWGTDSTTWTHYFDEDGILQERGD